MDIVDTLKKIFTIYFQDKSKQELLKNKEFDILSDELSDLFISEQFLNKSENKITDKLLKNLLKDEFKNILKNYREV